MTLSPPFTSLFLRLIRLYQRFISPLLPPACRFHPTCSEFAFQSIETHGLVRGGWLSVRRLCRCHPFNPGGLDPVPPPLSRNHPPQE